MGKRMKEIDRRLDRMIEIAEETGHSLDDVVRAIGRQPYSIFREVSDNPSRLPLYMKSKVSP
jgi:hypothetical protein